MLFNKKNDDLMHDYTMTPRPAVAPALSDHVQPPKSRQAPTRSVIDPGLIITGTLEGDGELQIDGHVRGDIRCTHLTVGNAATVDGNIAADEVVVRGKVKGVIGGNRVLLMDSAHVESNIFHKRLAIEEGACFEGEARFTEQPIEKARSKVVKTDNKACAEGETRCDEQPIEKVRGNQLGMESATAAATASVEADIAAITDPNSLSPPVKPPSARAPRIKAKPVEMESGAAPAVANPEADDRGTIDANPAPAVVKPSAEYDRLRARLRS